MEDNDWLHSITRLPSGTFVIPDMWWDSQQDDTGLEYTTFQSFGVGRDTKITSAWAQTNSGHGTVLEGWCPISGRLRVSLINTNEEMILTFQ